MVPLALANVLVNNLLARSRFGVVPMMVLLAVAYGFALNFMLNRFPGRLEIPLQTLGAFNLLLLAVCAWFTWGSETKSVNGGLTKPFFSFRDSGDDNGSGARRRF